MILIFTSIATSAHCKELLPPLKYDETKLKITFDKWIASLDYLPVPNDYSKSIKELFTADKKKQRVSIQTLGNTADIRVIPWLLPFLDAADEEISIWTASSIEKIISSLVYQDRANEEKVKQELKPIAWLVLKMFRKSYDGSFCGYAAQITAMLGFTEFEYELIKCTQSRHPAASNSAQSALKVLGLLRENEPCNKSDGDADK